MTMPVETVSEREQRKKHEISISDKERLQRHKEKRRLRRQNLAPRLRHAADGDGWQLTIPTSRSKLRWLGGSASGLIVFLALAYWWSKREFGAMVVIALILPFLCLVYLLYASLAGALRDGLVRFHVARDGGFSVRSRFRFLHRGTKAQCTVGIDYSRSSSLASLWLPGDKVIVDLGDRDLEILRSFCSTAGVPITSQVSKGGNKTSAESDGEGFEDHDDYVRRKWGTRFMVILGVGLLASVAWQVLSGWK